MTKGRLKVSEKFKVASDLFEQRAQAYGDNYWKCAHIMQTLFPDGLELNTEEDFIRKQFLEHIINKVTRYCNNFFLGGHADSSYDLSVYAMMLNAADEVFANDKAAPSENTSQNRKVRKARPSS